MNDKSLKNLKPFKKGKDERRNLKGRPKLPVLKELIEEIGETDMRAVVNALYTQAKRGNVKAIQEVLDRYYGKVSQHLDFDGNVKTKTLIEFKRFDNEAK